MEDCEICQREASSEEPPGGWVLRSEHWSACVAPGFEVPGWLFLQLRRHGDGPMAMETAEAAELGGLLARLSGAVQGATGAERVYVLAFGELYPHFHLLLVPRMPFAPPDETGPALFLKRAELVDPSAAAEVALGICRQLSAPP
ncbi:MAG: HIT family protein [Actinomycetota bacterium]|nr:HIT family protein [Actinomycetota bacterium]